jgi:nucleolar protein 4
MLDPFLSEGDPRKLFVAGIPLDATLSDTVRAFERFGRLSMIKFVAGQSGGHLGQAFVHFSDSFSGALCLDRFRRSHLDDSLLPLAVRGQLVLVMLQDSKDELSQSKSQRRRNLHLAREGCATLPASDRDALKRRRLWEDKQLKLADPAWRISNVRLCIANLPDEVTTSELRRVFTAAPARYARAHPADEPARAARAHDVRIMDVARCGDGAVVEFARPEHALAALREVDNNPEYFGRLIVAFALERGHVSRPTRTGEERGRMRGKRFTELEPPFRTKLDEGNTHIFRV